MKKAGFAQIMKGLEQFSDDQLTVDWAIDNIVIAGSPATVTEKLLAVREAGRPVRHAGADRPRLGRPGAQRSMALTAKEVMPALRRELGTALAAQ